MKTPPLIPFAAIALFAVSGCDKQSPDVAKKISELEQKTQTAAERQRELEQELEDQKLAVERDAIERERVRIEEDRAELERLQGDAAAAQDEALRRREDALSNREVKLERIQASLDEKEDDLQQQEQQLSDNEREMAGREALPFEQTEESEPVADYGMFYDSLESYGSWFETADYGYVFQPAVVRDSNWRPYARGRWACSDRGWTWVSEEPFGWATYHYGRWALLRGRGWIWVPGTEWAPSWVSWRENDSLIGWAPLPPETLAYRGHHWDSTVDVQFGISAACFNFMEIRNFGSPVYSHCLPVSGNGNWFQQTINITYIHIENRQVICGGPKYKKISDRVGRPLPFYRLEVDRHPRPSRDSLGLRPRVRGNHLVVSAPNIDAPWNDGLKPKRIKGRLENVTVERNSELSNDIRSRFRQNREEGRQKAETTIVELGGPEKFEQRRTEKLEQGRREADTKGRREEPREAVKNPGRPQREISGNRPADRQVKVDPLPDKVVRQPTPERVRPEVANDRKNPPVNDRPRITPAEEVKPRPQRQAEAPRVTPVDDSAQRENAGKRQQQEEARREQQQRQAEQAREAQQEAMNRRQEEQAQQRQQQQEKQREAEEAREARKQAMENERAQRQQQEEARQRQEERAQRQQQEEQDREMQRQQERAQQREQEQARQRQDEENQRQQEQSRQRQQEENQRQRQQEESRQKQEKDQKDQKDQEEQRKRNR